MRREEAIHRLEAVRERLTPYRVEAIYLFGSVARDEAGPQRATSIS
jgi:predicted nucleotidyltransferase